MKFTKINIIVSILVILGITILSFSLCKEGFSDKRTHKLFKGGFCETSTKDSKTHEDNCNSLVKDLCVTTDCCAYAKFKGEPAKCVAIRKGEPLFKNSKKGNPLESFIFQNKTIKL
jgi:hypothetical protein